MAATGKTTRSSNDANTVVEDIAERTARIREELTSLGEALAGAGSLQAGVARESVENRVNDLLKNGEQLLSEMGGQYSRAEKQVSATVREKPLQALGVAVAAGFLAAVLMRR